MVTKQVLITFAIGKYKDEVLCDVMPMEATNIPLGRPWQYDRQVLHDGHTNKMSFNFQGHKVILKPLSPKEVHEDQIKIKNKRENEKDRERKDKSGHYISPYTAKTIILTRVGTQTAPPRCSSSLSFSLPNKSKYLTSWTNKFLDANQTPPKGSHLLKGLSSKIHFIPKHSFQKWLISRTYQYELPKLHEHKLTSHTPPHNILYVNKLTMLFAGVLYSRSNSLQLGGHDTIQVAKKATKDLRNNSHCEQSSQQSSQGPTKYHTDLTRRRTWHRPKHQLFFLLVFLEDKNMFVNNFGSLLGSK